MATIRLTTKFFPLAFLLFLFPARAVIDGGEQQKVGWFKTTELQVTPGTHHLLVFFPYLFGPAGKGEIDVSVGDGQTVDVTYRAPLIVFMKGKIRTA